ncbi:hypothetical protein [Methylomonas koyamae]|uniref:hypothetical protein n=1 Tax=Methylomonas koyamae TaxID=702114 RepID=UPI000BC349DE|nr:hypothetical protein [Methylomonas koyamae]ATG92347.1 hypothetical protein MKLM6_4177 [Methylomonas koyamae]WNB75813.1 hypothetical protein RI210_21480 [Methylomonas koyamae]
MNSADTESGRNNANRGLEPLTCSCGRCGQLFAYEDRLMLAELTVCDACSDAFSLCVDCNAWTLLTELDAENSCSACRQAALPIQAYAYKPEPVFFGTGSKLFLGLELELNLEERSCDLPTLAGACLQILPYCYAKKDRSIRYGFELVSHPATLNYHRTAWSQALPAWNRIRQTHRFCCAGQTGIHVHLSKAFFSAAELAKLVYFCNQPTNRDFLAAIGQRPLGHWSRSEAGGIKQALSGEYDRYRVLNCNPAATVELRLFNGSERWEDILKNLEFADAIGHWIKQPDCRPGCDYRHFLAWLLGNPQPSGGYACLSDFVRQHIGSL